MDTDFVEFRQLQEVGVFSYLIYSLGKSPPLLDLFGKTALIRGRFLEESRHVALIDYFVKHVLEFLILIYVWY